MRAVRVPHGHIWAAAERAHIKVVGGASCERLALSNDHLVAHRAHAPLRAVLALHGLREPTAALMLALPEAEYMVESE